jgi:lysophospholipase L1-like esterase
VIEGGTQTAPINILLLGDSTVEGWASHQFEPGQDQLEDVVRKLLEAEGDLPPARVVNAGRGGEYVQGLLERRYDELLPEIKAAHFITVRYGLNDYGKREGFHENFQKDLVLLAERIRKDNATAEIIFETICCYFDEKKSAEVIPLIEKAASEAGVPLLDVYAGMKKEIDAGNTCLTYHRLPLDKIPAKLHALLPKPVKENEILVMDNRLDVHLRDVPGWFADKHPNSAGYHIIGDIEAKYLAPRIRARIGK